MFQLAAPGHLGEAAKRRTLECTRYRRLAAPDRPVRDREDLPAQLAVRSPRLEHRHYNASLISFDDLVGFPYPDDDKASVRFLKTPATVSGAESVLIDEINRCKPEHPRVASADETHHPQPPRHAHRPGREPRRAGGTPGRDGVPQGARREPAAPGVWRRRVDTEGRRDGVTELLG